MKNRHCVYLSAHVAGCLNTDQWRGRTFKFVLSAFVPFPNLVFIQTVNEVLSCRREEIFFDETGLGQESDGEFVWGGTSVKP